MAVYALRCFTIISSLYSRKSKYQSATCNNAEIASFLCQEWQKPRYTVAIPVYNTWKHVLIYCCLTSTEGKTVALKGVGTCDCSYEEADTRILLHADQAVEIGFSNACIAIKLPDTDDAIYAVPQSQPSL